MGVLGRLFGKSPREPDPRFMEMRSQALGVRAEDLNLSVDPESPIYGVIMETGLKEGPFTFLCMADGSVSIYFPNGGGIIGAGEHENVRGACFEMLSLTNKYATDFINACEKASECPLPVNGSVHFHLLTIQGTYTARCSERRLAKEQDPLSSLFNNCHAVMAEAREVSENDRDGQL